MNEDVFKPTNSIDCLQIDSVNKLFKVKGQSGDVFKQKEKKGIIKSSLNIMTAGISNKIGNAIKSNKGKIYNFSDLSSYELLEDDSSVTSGGTGRALVGGALFHGNGAVVGAMTGKKKTKKVIESLVIKLTVNDFENPCIMIPLITKPTKTKSKEYEEAYNKAQKILSMLEIITNQNKNE